MAVTPGNTKHVKHVFGKADNISSAKLSSTRSTSKISTSSIHIRFADAHLLIVEKPAGMTTRREGDEGRRGRASIQPTLEELLPAALARHLGWKADALVERIERRGPQMHRKKPRLPPVSAVHRLDRDTSGLMIFARTIEAEHLLTRQFARHAIERVYTAVVLGRIDSPRMIDTHIARDRGDGHRGSIAIASVSESSSTKPAMPCTFGARRNLKSEARSEVQHALTNVQPVGHIRDDYTIIECRLETGRTHQIRIHLSEIGHAVCGDKMYRCSIADRSAAPRQALHAGKLGFLHPITGKRMEIAMPLPDDLSQWLTALKRNPRGGA